MKYILRDLLWLIVVVSLAAGWYAHSRQVAQTIESQAQTIEQQKAEIASRDSDLDRAFHQERQLRMDRGIAVLPSSCYRRPDVRLRRQPDVCLLLTRRHLQLTPSGHGQE